MGEHFFIVDLMAFLLMKVKWWGSQMLFWLLNWSEVIGKESTYYLLASVFLRGKRDVIAILANEEEEKEISSSLTHWVRSCRQRSNPDQMHSQKIPSTRSFPSLVSSPVMILCQRQIHINKYLYLPLSATSLKSIYLFASYTITHFFYVFSSALFMGESCPIRRTKTFSTCLRMSS